MANTKISRNVFYFSISPQNAHLHGPDAQEGSKLFSRVNSPHKLSPDCQYLRITQKIKGSRDNRASSSLRHIFIKYGHPMIPSIPTAEIIPLKIYLNIPHITSFLTSYFPAKYRQLLPESLQEDNSSEILVLKFIRVI